MGWVPPSHGNKTTFCSISSLHFWRKEVFLHSCRFTRTPGNLEQAAQDLVQVGLEHLQRRRLHNLPGQPVPGFRHPPSRLWLLSLPLPPLLPRKVRYRIWESAPSQLLRKQVPKHPQEVKQNAATYLSTACNSILHFTIFQKIFSEWVQVSVCTNIILCASTSCFESEHVVLTQRKLLLKSVCNSLGKDWKVCLLEFTSRCTYSDNMKELEGHCHLFLLDLCFQPSCLQKKQTSCAHFCDTCLRLNKPRSFAKFTPNCVTEDRVTLCQCCTGTVSILFLNTEMRFSKYEISI